jgi:hypothetical protein
MWEGYMKNNRKHLIASLKTALGYGLGFVVGVTVIKLTLDSGLLNSVADLFENQHLTAGIILLFVVIFIGGALAGAIGGLSLWFALSLDDWKRPTSRSAVGFGFGFGIVLMPIVILVAALSLYNSGDASQLGFVLSMGVVGLLFGFVSGIMTATLPQRANYWQVTRISTLAFGIGGLAFGFGLWHYFFSLYQTGAGTAELLFSILIFGVVGGFVLGWSFSRDLERITLVDDSADLHGNIFYRAGQWIKTTKFYQKRGFWGTIIFLSLIFLLSRLLAMSPLNFSEASLSETLPLDSIGVHWSESWVISNKNAVAKEPSIAGTDDLLAVTWEQGDAVYFTTSTPENDGLRIWQPWILVSESRGSAPKIAVDSEGRAHLIWVEGITGEEGTSQILYRSCQDGKCSEAVTLSNSEAECSGDRNFSPTIAVNMEDTIMVIWASSSGTLASKRWEAADKPPNNQSCVILDLQGTPSNPYLASGHDREFALVFENGDEIILATSAFGSSFIVNYEEDGRMPYVFVDTFGVVHAAWCGVDGQIRYREEDSPIKVLPSQGCINRPVLGQDANGILHLLWYADQVVQQTGLISDSNLIYENRFVSGVWTEPIIVDLTASGAQPAIVSDQHGKLHLVWEGGKSESGQIHFSNFRIYECAESKLNIQGQLALDVALSGKYRPKNDLVPYCHNRFDDLLILPKADPAYSDNPPTLNGAFDEVSDLIQDARYEVLLSTMWYETDDTGTSPGVVLAQGVRKLYDKVKDNPGNYPRGMTVRILLGNPPEFTFSNLISQVWNVFRHMRYAGVPTMSDPTIGWKLEIANFDGSWPHGHTKMVVIDGKTAVAAGFNYQHKHQSKDHPSGKGKADFDLGLQMTGPVAQTTRIAFDDLWSGSHSIVCPELDSESPLWWISCRRVEARADHVPEVEKLYLASENFNAFAMHRTTKFNESDVTLPKTIASAQETLDVLQVNFTLKLICDLNLLLEVCDFRDALSYMQSMMDAIEANQVKTRVLIKPGPIEAVESNIAVDAFRDAVEVKGLSHLVEFRYFQDSVHAKAVLIDDQFLLVGSQNFHYSAFGDGGLTEFNISTDDPDAIADFKRFFDFHWERAEPIPVNE